MATIRKKELTDKIAETHHFRSVLTKQVIQSFLDEILRELDKGNRLEFRDFGVFEPRLKKGMIGQNPKTLEKVPVPDHRIVKFKMGQAMRKRLNGEKKGRQL